MLTVCPTLCWWSLPPAELAQSNSCPTSAAPFYALPQTPHEVKFLLGHRTTNKHSWAMSVCFLELPLLQEHDRCWEGDSKHLGGADGVMALCLVSISQISKIINDEKEWGPSDTHYSGHSAGWCLCTSSWQVSIFLSFPWQSSAGSGLPVYL